MSGAAVALADSPGRERGRDDPETRPVSLVGSDVLEIAHRAAHHVLADVTACCFVAVGAEPNQLCGERSPANSVVFERLAGRILGSSVMAEDRRVHDGAAGRFASVIPFEGKGSVLGRLHVLTDTVPDLVMLERIATLAAVELRRAGALLPVQRSGVALGLAVPATVTRPSSALPTVSDLVHAAHESLNTTVALLGPDLAAIATAGRRADVRAWQWDREVVLRVAALGEPTLVPRRQGQPARVLAPIHRGSALLGFLVAEGVEFTPWVRATVLRYVEILSWVMRVDLDVAGDTEQRRAALVADLVAERNMDGIATRAGILGHDLGREHQPYAFALTDTDVSEGDPGLVRLERLLRQECRRVTGGADCLIGTIGTTVLAFVPAGAGDPCAFGAQAVAAAAEGGLRVSCGVGAVCRDPAGFALGARQARRAVEVLACTGHRDTVRRYDDLGVLGLLFSAKDSTRLDEYVQRWLGPLLAYDRDTGSELAKTIEQLLEKPTMVDAARALYIHVSTLKYRYKRIQELLGTDLHDSEAMFNLQLASKLHRILQDLSSGAD